MTPSSWPTPKPSRPVGAPIARYAASTLVSPVSKAARCRRSPSWTTVTDAGALLIVDGMRVSQILADTARREAISRHSTASSVGVRTEPFLNGNVFHPTRYRRRMRSHPHHECVTGDGPWGGREKRLGNNSGPSPPRTVIPQWSPIWQSAVARGKIYLA